MATYNITETDKTLATSQKNSTSNFVFLPINSSWGPDDKVIEVSSLKELVANFGTAPDTKVATKLITSNDWPNKITAYSYAKGILGSGLSLALARMTNDEQKAAYWKAPEQQTETAHDENLLTSHSSDTYITKETTTAGLETKEETVLGTTAVIAIVGEGEETTYKITEGYKIPNDPFDIATASGVSISKTISGTTHTISVACDADGNLSGASTPETISTWKSLYDSQSETTAILPYSIVWFQTKYKYTFNGKTKYTKTNEKTNAKIEVKPTEESETTYTLQNISVGDGTGVVTGSTENATIDWAEAYKLLQQGRETDPFYAQIDSYEYTYTPEKDEREIGLKTTNAIKSWIKKPSEVTTPHIEINEQGTVYEKATLTIVPASFTAKYKGTYGNNISVYFQTKLKAKTVTQWDNVGKIDKKTEKFVKIDVVQTYTYALLMYVLVNGAQKEELEIANINFTLDKPTYEQISETGTKASYTLTVIPANIESDYVNINLNIKAEVPTSWVEEISQKTVANPFTGGTDITEDVALTEFASFLTTQDSRYEALCDKWLTDIKFLSAGPYADAYDALVTEQKHDVADGLIGIASTRGDCIAFVDHQKEFTTTSEVEGFASNLTKSSYGALYSPWCLTYSPDDSTATCWVPPSYYALKAIGNSWSSGNSICAIPAGVNRGAVSIIRPQFEIGRTTMEKWQKGEDTDLNYCINPIMNIRNFGYCIFGQRNLLELAYGTTSALQEVGVRITLNEIKKWVRDVCINLTFDYNTSHTWNEFVTRVQSCLNTLVDDGALTNYSITRDDDLEEQVNTNTLKAVIQVYVTRALENFDINIEVQSGEVSVTETSTELE